MEIHQQTSSRPPVFPDVPLGRPRKPRPVRPLRLPAAFALWLLLGLAGLAGTSAFTGRAAAQAGAADGGGGIIVHRTVFEGEPDRPVRDLPPGTEVEMRDEIWRLSGALSLRVESIDPETVVVTQLLPRDASAGTLLLTLIVVSRERLFDFHYRGKSQVLEGGAMVEHRRFRVREGIATDLAGAPGEVVEIRIQDDATAELRLVLSEGQLVLRTIPEEEGGTPSGNVLPIYFGRQLRFLDYDLLGAGGTDNGYGEIVLLEDFALMVNFLTSDGESALLARAVVRQQVLRWRRVSITIEGGAAFFGLDPDDPSVENEGEPTIVGGATLHMRFGNWGWAAHVSSVNGPVLAMVLAGWQFGESWGGFLEWQSFEGLSGFGLGLSLLY